MESFFAQHAGIVIAFINILILVIIGLLGLADLLRGRARTAEKDLLNQKIRFLESRVTTVEAQFVSKELISQKFEHLSAILENYVHSLEKKIDENKKDSDDKFEGNVKEHRSILGKVEAGFKDILSRMAKVN